MYICTCLFASLLKAPEEGKPEGTRATWSCFSVFSVENYQKYFRVSTRDVSTHRALGAHGPLFILRAVNP